MNDILGGVLHCGLCPPVLRMVTGTVVAQLKSSDATVQGEVVLAAADRQLTTVVHLCESIQTGLNTNNSIFKSQTVSNQAK